MSFGSPIEIHGRVRVELREEDGSLVVVREVDNIWTLTGREFLTRLISLASRSPRLGFRDDKVAYIGIGSGVQPKVATVTSLVNPVPYRTGEFLAPLAVPVDFPLSGSGTPKTIARFSREYGRDEISIAGNVVVTEVGLYTDGDPDNNWDFSATPVDFATTAGRAPVAYNTFEPITKTNTRTLAVIWDVRVI